jgi:hypothetical protein
VNILYSVYYNTENRLAHFEYEVDWFYICCSKFRMQKVTNTHFCKTFDSTNVLIP